ncbi:hypothetical protein HPP92_021440 [Vanilla planifolia]|uniref:Autophagy-related protein 16 domain-containing protein n=1 Tax=Vanilla planifolia TaxID=51239 RepID=A0A835PY56_VANPL|nr:hypothetical protein HPP92_021440 [Vanilla planifolia]
MQGVNDMIIPGTTRLSPANSVFFPAEIALVERTTDEIGREAIRRAMKALRKRHLLEEGAHAPAIAALSRPFAAQVESQYWSPMLENERRFDIGIIGQEENSQLKECLDEKTEALVLVLTENHSLQSQMKDVMQKLNDAQAENKNLIDRWMLEKMKDAEKLNEVNALYEEMMQQLKVSSIEQLARLKADGVVRQREAGYCDDVPDSAIPSACKHVLHAHDGGCGSISFEHSSNNLISGGHDRAVKIWDANTGTLRQTLRGSVSSILDLAVTHDNKFVIGASGSNHLFVWESSSARIRHSLTGHADKVCGVDAGRHSARHVVSAAYDHTIKLWDLQKGYCVNTIISISNCNAVAYGLDGLTIWSGHVDGNLRLWDGRSGKLLSEVAAHSQSVTSVAISRSGNMVLTSGRDNVHNLFDVRTLEICGAFRGNGNRVASNWSRSCISGDERFVAAGSADGSVYVWPTAKTEPAIVLEGHDSPVLCCAWNAFGRTLASSDKNGTICIWG